MKKKEKLVVHKILLILLLLFNTYSYSQDTIFAEGSRYCSRSLVDIIKDDNKILIWTFPENKIEHLIYTKIDSSFFVIKKNKKEYTVKRIDYDLSNGWKLKLISPVDNLNLFYSIELENYKIHIKKTLFFKEKVKITLQGLLFYKNNKKSPKLFFLSIFDGYTQHFSVSLDDKILVVDPPSYKICQ
jgi:hypothetical protein